ncbi:MAG: DNA mismatch repair protein MutL [Bacteroidetes bacterium RIFCSPLOWO2_12_FULL_31_6]|nr:MAG: DNA mismatch repair protein MutL [Bacteroidetes bacterium RIFCSPLOWO2_12_FULL_31_6]
MSDIIQLLPDSVANQIAAGEVIQRPASAVKELLENAIDANADTISLVIKDAGKALIQVNDNGTGMSDTDARLSFERHATSKIKCSDDLFKISTKGFRGEALASIAAIAQVELKTKKENCELGTKIIVEASEVKEQEPCTTSKGTSFSLKNLFYNVPARRNFLKSNAIEIRHIIEEFQRVALVHADIAFTMYNNGNEVLNLNKGSFRQRIVGVFGSKYNEKLVPISVTTDVVSVEGFVSKPEFAKKTRGEQYFFVNDRFIKNAYLNHAVQNAFDQLLSKDQYPSYFLKLTIDPSKIDINIHPTKTEIKFEDERSIYAIIRTAVKQGLGKFNISPTLDFEQESSFNVPLLKRTDVIKAPVIKVNPNYNPFESKPIAPPVRQQSTANWESLYESFHKDTEEILHHTEQKREEQQLISSDWENEEQEEHNTLIQLHNKFILTQLKSGMLLIDQQRAHERILYEEFSRNLAEEKASSQKLLFPETIDFTAADAELMNELQDEIKNLGFEIKKMGSSNFKVTGIPPELKEQNIKKILEGLLEQFKLNESELKLKKRENLSISIARSASIKAGKKLAYDEMKALVDQLFACDMPYSSPSGKKIVITLNLEDLNQQFES